MMIKTHLLETSTVIRKAREQAVRCEKLHHEACDVTDTSSLQILSIDSLIERADKGFYKLDPYR
jgi:hypothetical protein